MKYAIRAYWYKTTDEHLAWARAAEHVVVEIVGICNHHYRPAILDNLGVRVSFA